MQSSYSVIKNNRVDSQGKKLVDTDYGTLKYKEAIEINEETSKKHMDSYENLARTILDNARKQSEELLSKAVEDAERIEREAYEKAYSLGVKKGHDEGYKDSYEKNMKLVIEEKNRILGEANSLLREAKVQYEEYLEEKRESIIDLALTIAETILKKQIQQKNGLDELIFTALSDSRDAQTFIIKCNNTSYENLKEQVVYFKEKLALKAEVFVILDESIKDGVAVIEKDNGTITVDVHKALNEIREEMLS